VEVRDDAERRWLQRYVRSSVAPGALIAEIRRFLDTDVRPVLSAVSAPTLVLVDPSGTEDYDPRNGRMVAERIRGARLVELLPTDLPSWPHWYGPADQIVREVASFLASIDEAERRFDRVLSTVMFTDIVDSTAIGARMGDRAWRDVRTEHDAIVRSMLGRYRGHEVKTMGDGFLATFDGPARGVACATAIVEQVRPLGIEIRAGLHTGEITIDGDDVAGIGVTIGARIGASAGSSEVLVSQTVKDLVAGSGLVFEDAGEHELKGVPDRWRLYRVVA
jgi:class 3 adenylate cyclase